MQHDILNKPWKDIRLKGESEHGTVTQVKDGPRKGTWIAGFNAFDWQGKRRQYRSTGHSSKRAARQALDELKRRAIGNKVPPAAAEVKVETVAEFIDRWHKRRVERGKKGMRGGIRASTAQQNLGLIKVVKESSIASMPIDRVTRRDVRAFVAWLEDDRLPGKGRTCEGAYGVLRSALRAWAKEAEAPSPTDGVEAPVVQESRQRLFTTDELRAILAGVDDAGEGGVPDLTFAALIHLLAGTGMRIGEAQALRWKGVDFEASTINVEASMAEIAGEGLVRGPTKSGRARKVRMPRSVAARLKALQRFQQGSVLPLRREDDDRFVFTNAVGQPLRQANIRDYRWKPLLERLEIDHQGLHALRHTYASHQLARGESPATVQQILGHKKLSITLDIYSHALPDGQEQAADAWDQLITAGASGE